MGVHPCRSRGLVCVACHATLMPPADRPPARPPAAPAQGRRACTQFAREARLRVEEGRVVLAADDVQPILAAHELGHVGHVFGGAREGLPRFAPRRDQAIPRDRPSWCVVLQRAGVARRWGKGGCRQALGRQGGDQQGWRAREWCSWAAGSMGSTHVGEVLIVCRGQARRQRRSAGARVQAAHRSQLHMHMHTPENVRAQELRESSTRPVGYVLAVTEPAAVALRAGLRLLSRPAAFRP